MALRISFKPGQEQSRQAARYFQGAVGNLVESLIGGMEERDYRMGGDSGPALHLSVWSKVAPDDAMLHVLVDHILALRADTHALQEAPKDPQRVASTLASWLSPRLEGADLFVELTIEDPGGSAAEQPAFSLGLVRGRCVLVSTDTCLFSWLQEDVFGLTLAGHGSYLVEVEGRQRQDRSLRKAS